MKEEYSFPCPVCGKPMTWNELYTHLMTHSPKLKRRKNE